MCALPEKKYIIELLELYSTLPALWDIRSPDYTNRQLKKEQYNILLQKYRETHPNAGKKDLAKRLNSLRTNYRREYNRVKSGENNADGPYKPTLFYFDTLNFLNSVEAPSCSKTSIKQNEPERELELDPLQQQPECKKRKPNTTDELVKLATARLKNPPDTCQQMANVWGLKLSKMDRMQRIIAERVINEVMFSAELGLLNMNTGLTNIGTVYNINTSPTITEPKQEIITIENNNIFGI